MPTQATPAKSTRRRHAPALKRELVERCLQPGASVSRIALENGINTNVLFRWRRQHLRAIGRVQEPSAEQAVLLPVNVAAVRPTKRDAMSADLPAPAGIIEIDIGAARVRLRGAVDEANLRCVLHTLRAIA